MTTLWSDINTGNTRDCQPAIEEVGESLVEIEESDVPANYVVRLRAEQAGLRKSLLRVCHIQREQFLHSATAMITTTVAVTLALLLVTDKGGLAESLVTLGFLSFFFLYLLRLLSIIDTPFKVGEERTDDDVSLFLLTEFIVHVQAAELEAAAEAEEASQDATSATSHKAATAGDRTARPDA